LFDASFKPGARISASPLKRTLAIGLNGPSSFSDPAAPAPADSKTLARTSISSSDLPLFITEGLTNNGGGGDIISFSAPVAEDLI
jgi:hypothetical protein